MKINTILLFRKAFSKAFPGLQMRTSLSNALLFYMELLKCHSIFVRFFISSNKFVDPSIVIFKPTGYFPSSSCHLNCRRFSTLDELLFYIFNKKRLLLYISPVSICFWAIAIEVRVSDCNVAWSEWNSQLDTICNPIRTYHGIAHYKIPVSRKIFREGSSRFSVCHYNAPSV